MNIRKLQLTTMLLLISGLMLSVACGDGGEKVSLTPVAEANDNTNEVMGEVQQEEVPAASAEQEYGTVVLVNGGSSYDAVGSFIAFETVTVSAKVGGTIAKMHVDKGDRVNRNSLVSTLDPEDFELAIEAARAQLDVAEAGLKNARNEFERKKKLFEDGAISQGQFDGVTTQLELAQANKRVAEVQLRRAEKALKDTITPAGASGLVSNRMMAAGEYIASGDPLIEISVLDPIKLTFSVPERLAQEVTKGSAVSVTLAAFPGSTFTGVVTLVGPTIDPTTRTIPLEATFENDEMTLRPGFFANATIRLNQQRRVFVVPTTAIVDTDSGPQVCIVGDDGVEQWAPVTPVQQLGDGTRVFADLKDGQRVKLQR